MPNILNNIPNNLEVKLLEEYTEVKRRFQLNDCGPSELNGGRFAEVALRIFQHLLGEPISPFEQEIKSEQKTKILNKIEITGSVDIHIRQKVSVLVRMLLDFRNNRDVAHLGGFSANRIDANFVLSCTNWIVAEFIRVYGNFSLEKAQELIDKIAIPNYPVIFDIEGEEFIARNSLTVKQEVLVLVAKNKRDFNFLFSKTKDSNRSRFKNTLSSLQKEKKVALKDGFYHILPNGIEEVRKNNLLNLN